MAYQQTFNATQTVEPQGKTSQIHSWGLVCALSIFTAATFIPILKAEAHDGQVSVKVKDGKRCFSANGLPNHETGDFPNRYNPNAISPQNIDMCVTTEPTKGRQAAAHKGAIGIGVNGVQFRPGTAGYYDASNKRGHSRNPASGWKLEGINPGNILGMDTNNAHVGPNGLYHYHGVANALVKSAGNGPIGYAADGFEIHYSGSNQKSSFQLKPGTRPSGPGGKYDGTYEEDWQYVSGSGTLDQCNGGQLNGKFVYFATETYPFLPRCLWGKVSADFKGPEHGAENGNQLRKKAGRNGKKKRGEAGRARKGKSGNRRKANNRSRRGPPEQAVQACEAKSQNATCSFKAPRRNRDVSGTCQTTPRGINACVPERRRRPRT